MDHADGGDGTLFDRNPFGKAGIVNKDQIIREEFEAWQAAWGVADGYVS